MKKIGLFISVAIFAINAMAQVDTVWTKAIGGALDEAIGMTINCNIGSPSTSIAKSADGNLYIVASSLSSNGFVYSNKGEDDVWIIKLNMNGDTLWTKSYGGSSYDRANKVISMPDGGCVVVGRTSSDDFDFAIGHGSNGDGFLIRLDANGNQIWKKMYGGTNDDYLYDVILADGGLVAVGESGSIDGDLFNSGNGLAWIMKVDSVNGNKVWSKTIAGPDAASADFLENFYRVIALSDGSGYIATGYTTPSFIDVNLDDIYIAKISLTGTRIWSIEAGSNEGGDYPSGIVEGANGDFFIAGRLQGQAGDVYSTYRYGNGDFWLLKYGADGNKIWDKNYGGSNLEFAFDMKKDSNNDLYLAGFTKSTDMDASSNSYGLMDFWLVKTNADGDTLYTKRAGGSQNDVALGIEIIAPNSFILAGKTLSSDLCVHGNNGGQDLWLVKYADASASIKNNNSMLNISVNTFNKEVNIINQNQNYINSVIVYDLIGNQVFVSDCNNNSIKNSFMLDKISSGVYIIKVNCKHGIFSQKINMF